MLINFLLIPTDVLYLKTVLNTLKLSMENAFVLNVKLSK